MLGNDIEKMDRIVELRCLEKEQAIWQRIKTALVDALKTTHNKPSVEICCRTCANIGLGNSVCRGCGRDGYYPAWQQTSHVG